MKAKFLENGWSLMTKDKTYRVKQSKIFSDMFTVLVMDNGEQGDWYKSRFELLPENPVEQKTAEIKETEARLAVLKKELEELTEPKVGQKFSHNHCNNKYILVDLEDRFALVCYEGKDVGYVYHLPEEESSPKSAFCGNEYAFTLLPE